MYSQVDSTNQDSSGRIHNVPNDRSVLAPCQDACPLHMHIREYIDLVAQGKVMESLQVIRNDNPFPSVWWPLKSPVP